MMSSKNSGFTAGDIDRYHSGNMSAGERHALEKAALDDPFLADALEGLALTPTPSADLATIQSRLNKRSNRKYIVPFSRPFRWLMAAAALLIIAGVGWLVFSVSTKQGRSVAVVNKTNPKPKEPAGTTGNNPNSVNLPAKDSLSTNRDSTLTAQQAGEASPAQPISNSLAMGTQDRSKKESGDKSLETSVATSLNPQSATQNNVATNNVLSDYEKNAIPRAAQPGEARSNNISEYKFNKTESNKEIVAAPQLAGRVQAVILKDTATNLDIVMHPLPPDSLGLHEVVVSGYSTKKKPVANAYHPHVVIDSLEPEEGSDSFEDYVADNFNLPEEYKTNTPSGEVQLSFDVDRNGQPTNITVVKSLCQKCDEEAIRMLKEGPKWKKKKDKKGKITIAF